MAGRNAFIDAGASGTSQRAGPLVTFREFMESALYDPRKGYYPTRAVNQDFYTAPELHPAFGWVLARRIVSGLSDLKRRGIPGPYSVVEMGSGSGLLARQILETWQNEFPDWASSIRYILVERSQERLLESVQTLSSLNPRILGYSGVEDLPPCTGVFFSNELVDSFPFHLLERHAGRIMEVYVDSEGKSRLGSLSRPELRPIAESIASSLPEGGRHAVNLEARDWIRTMAEKIHSGCLITIDYGKRFPSPSSKTGRLPKESRSGVESGAPPCPSRSGSAFGPRRGESPAGLQSSRPSRNPSAGQGHDRRNPQRAAVSGEWAAVPVNPPRSYFRHSTGPEMTRDKGTRDITASTDFEALIQEGAKHGLTLESYSTLGRYLIDGGIVDWLSRAPKSVHAANDLAAFKDRSKIKTLIHPEGMGETFKVLVQSKS